MLVCASPLPEVQDDRETRAALLRRPEVRVSASRAAEATAGQAVATAAAACEGSRAAYDLVNAQLPGSGNCHQNERSMDCSDQIVLRF